MRITRNTQLIIGNVLIIVSILGFSIIFYPVVLDYLSYSLKLDNYNPSNPDSFSIDIPAIRVQSTITPHVNPWQKHVYQKALENGIAHAEGSVLPGETGTIYLFAHSSDNPFSLTRYNTSFFRLHNLPEDSYITLNYQQNQFSYKVTQKITVNPTDVSYLTQSKDNQLILQTCTPIGTDWKRLLVIAVPVE